MDKRGFPLAYPIASPVVSVMRANSVLDRFRAICRAWIARRYDKAFHHLDSYPFVKAFGESIAAILQIDCVTLLQLASLRCVIPFA